LLHKRIELLKAVDPFLRSLPDWSLDFDHSQLGTPFPFVFSDSRFLTPWNVKQACLSCAPSAVNRRLLGPNHHALPVGLVSACPDALYAAFPSKARRLSLPSRVVLVLRNSLF
jgi:hypothetical protein